MNVDEKLWEQAVGLAKEKFDDYRKRFAGVKSITGEDSYEMEAPIEVVFSAENRSPELLADVLATTVAIYEATFNSPGTQRTGGIRKKC